MCLGGRKRNVRDQWPRDARRQGQDFSPQFRYEKKGGEDGCEDNPGQEFAHAAGVRPGFGHNSILPPSR